MVNVNLLTSISDYEGAEFYDPGYLVSIPDIDSSLKGSAVVIFVLWAGRRGGFHAQHKYGGGAAIVAWSIMHAEGSHLSDKKPLLSGSSLKRENATVPRVMHHD